MSLWIVDPEVFSSMISIIYWSMGICTVTYIAEIMIIFAAKLGFSKRLTYYWMFGLLAVLIAWVIVSTWGTAVWGAGATFTTPEGVEVAEVAIGHYFIAFIVLLLFGLVMCGVTAVAIVRKYAEEIKIIEKAEVGKSTAKDADKYVQVRRERLDSDSEVIKDMKEKSKEYVERYKEIKSRR